MKSKLFALSVVPLALVAGLVLVPGASAPVSAASAPAVGGSFSGGMGARVFPSGSTVVNLASEGIYNPALYGWAVVFDYTTINVDPGAVVTFLNHPSGAPVIWHATGDILIEGTLDLSGQAGASYLEADSSFALPGPGGFRGGRKSYYSSSGSSAGLGPGGGLLGPGSGQAQWGNGGSYATPGNVASGGVSAPTYGAAGLFPLIGGSGGSAAASRDGRRPGAGGGGGGALILASEMGVHLTSQAQVICNGGAGGRGNDGGGADGNHGGKGSGGAIRIVADNVHIDVGAFVEARGNAGTYGADGGVGRIRIEADSSLDSSKLTVDGAISPAASIVEQLYEIIPTAEPTLQIVELDSDGLAGPDGWSDVTLATLEPTAELFPPSAADLSVPLAGTIALKIRANNVAFGEIVIVRLSHTRGQAVFYSSSPLASTGVGMESEAVAEIDVSGGVSAIQLRVDYND